MRTGDQMMSNLNWDRWLRRGTQVLSLITFIGLILADALGFLVNSPSATIYFMLIGFIAGLEKLEDWIPRKDK